VSQKAAMEVADSAGFLLLVFYSPSV